MAPPTLLTNLLKRHHLRHLLTRLKPKPPPPPHKPPLLPPLLPLLSTLPPLLFLHTHIAQLMFINGPSMAPLLCPDWNETARRDVVLSWMWDPVGDTSAASGSGASSGGSGVSGIGKRGLKRGEIVAFWSPLHPTKMAVKRVIALEGDTVYPSTSYPIQKATLTVPIGHVWVEGEVEDPRFNIDSHCYGPVSMGLIMGKITHILWPIGRMGRIGMEGWKKRTRVIEATEEEVDALYMELDGAEVPDSYTAEPSNG